jgi:molybdate transport system substrate-binding protein
MMVGMRRAAIVLASVLLAAGCGSGEDAPSSSAKPPLIVSAAASLKNAFTAYGGTFEAARVRSSFAGSDELAAQIRQGVRPDVFASANTKLPDELFQEGLVEHPVVFAANELVLAVPAGSPVTRLEDLTRKGTTIAMGSESVPVGSYTRKVLDGLPAAQKAAILGNVRSNEPDVAGVVGKVSQGAVDAGFVYVTDVDATEGKLKAIALPPGLKPQVAYGVAVVKGAKHPRQAKQFIDGLLRGAGREALDRAGFLPPPGA